MKRETRLIVYRYEATSSSSITTSTNKNNYIHLLKCLVFLTRWSQNHGFHSVPRSWLTKEAGLTGRPLGGQPCVPYYYCNSLCPSLHTGISSVHLQTWIYRDSLYTRGSQNGLLTQAKDVPYLVDFFWSNINNLDLFGGKRSKESSPIQWSKSWSEPFVQLHNLVQWQSGQFRYWACPRLRSHVGGGKNFRDCQHHLNIWVRDVQ